MDYEKAYKDALERAREELGSGCFDRGTVEYIFPELAQSEDERIRKVLLAIINDAKGNGCNTYYAVPINDIIAWLDKQGEQSKQQLYDIIIALWDLLDKIDTFADLKINDTDPNNPFRKIEHLTQERHRFVKSDGYNLFIDDLMITNEKMEKQGEQKQDPCEDCDHIMLNCGNFPCEEKKGYNVEQKSVWSEEDERMIEHICYALPKMAMGNIEILPSIAEEYAERLKSLKNRVQPHWKPTQEQLMALRDAIDNNEMESLYNDLKKL